jgi:hypothetical protein
VVSGSPIEVRCCGGVIAPFSSDLRCYEEKLIRFFVFPRHLVILLKGMVNLTRSFYDYINGTIGQSKSN